MRTKAMSYKQIADAIYDLIHELDKLRMGENAEDTNANWKIRGLLIEAYDKLYDLTQEHKVVDL